jgi:hypothetical protein
LLIAEEQLVVRRVSAVVGHPVVTRVVNIFLCLCTSIDDTDLRGSGDKKHRSFICRAFSIWVNEVDKGWDPCEVNDLVIALKTAWRFF